MPIADNGSQGVIRMWPSEEVAARLYNLANWGLVAGLVLGVVSTVLLVWMGNVKETYLKTQLSSTGSVSAQANERSKVLEKDNLKLRADLTAQVGQVAGLQKDASDAKAAQQQVQLELAKQQERAATAEEKLLELAKKQAGRTIAKGALSSLLKGKAVGTLRIWYEPDDTEAYQFAMDIFSEFTGTGWKVTGVERIPDDASMASTLPREARGQISESQMLAVERRFFPISLRAGGGSGLALIAKSIQPGQPEDGAFRVLYGALLSVNKQLVSKPDVDLLENSFIIVVGPKP